MRKPTSISHVRAAGVDHQVITIVGGGPQYRRVPCSGCPWRKDTTGEFPAEAFRHSANTAYDMSDHVFGCHESGKDKPATCAGFLLRGAHHNLSVRLGYMEGRYRDDVQDGGHELHADYRTMAIANGLDESDSALKHCRGDGY